MKNYRLTIFLILISCCLVSLIQSNALAETQPKGKDLVIKGLPKIDRTKAESIVEQLGLRNIFNNVVDFIEGIQHSNNQTLKAQTPDWNLVKDTIEGVDTRAKELAQQLEDRTTDSFNINQDESEQVQRELIQASISTSTTSTEAQEILAASLVEIENTLKKSGDLSQDSAKTDVSQQILQNLSEQTGINSQLLGTISAQNIQAQQDRSNQISLALQQARHNSIETTRLRREASIATDLGTTAWGAISTPTFLYEKP